MTDIEKLLEKPYWIVDILPKQVPENSPGQYFAAEEYWLQEPHISELHRKFFQILLKLNCYYNFRVSVDYGEHWIKNPAPENMEKWVLVGGFSGAVCVMPEDDTLFTLASDDTYMTVYNPAGELLEFVRALAGAEGLFVWKP